MSNYLANLMRHGADGYNCFLTISGTTFTLQGYGGNLQGNTPAYIRFSNGQTLILQTNLTFNISGLNWDLLAEGAFSLFVGVQLVSSGVGQLAVALNPLEGVVSTLQKADCYDTLRHVAAPNAATGPITWLFEVRNAIRTNSGWDFSQATIGLL